MRIEYIKLNEDAIEPTRGSDYAAGYDLYAISYSKEVKTIKIKPHETKLINTGIAMKIPEGYFGGIYARSGLSVKQGLRPSNCVGVIDSDYRGEIMVALHNDSNEIQKIKVHDRIAQLIIQKFEAVEFVKTETLDNTDRGSGGFGSTGA